MTGDDDIIELLNDVLTGELTAINQYFIDTKLCAHWGYERLAVKVVVFVVIAGIAGLVRALRS